jgi:hypothetical protein
VAGGAADDARRSRRLRNDGCECAAGRLEIHADAFEDNVVLYRVEDGRRTPLGAVGRGDDYGVKHPVPAERRSTLAVGFDGTRFAVSFDGEPLFEVVDATFNWPGGVGLWTKADSVTYFDGLEVEAR